jgi:hypothetical protein
MPGQYEGEMPGAIHPDDEDDPEAETDTETEPDADAKDELDIPTPGGLRGR